MVVMILANEGMFYYDEQKIPIPEGKCLRQIGTSRYTTVKNIDKTVPIVQVFDR